MRIQVHVSLAIETMHDLDNWRERRSLSRGDAIAALLRLAAGGGEIVELGTARAARPDVGGGRMVANIDTGVMERVVELEGES